MSKIRWPCSFIGRTFGRLTILSNPLKGDRNYAVKTKCICGSRQTLMLYNIIRGRTRSCGCLKKEYDQHLIDSGVGDPSKCG